MATAALRRWGWPVAAALAALVLVALAVHGRRPDPGLVRFEAAGPMREIAPEAVSEVEVTSAGRRWRFARGPGSTWMFAGSEAGADSGRVERALRLLHDSAPQRVLAADEVGGTLLVEFGLEPPRYRVTVRATGAAPFTIAFGAPNPQGLAQYARVEGRAELLLLSRFVGAEWEAATAPR